MQNGFPITIIQGATYSRQVTYVDQDGNPVDLTGYSAQMMFRTTVDGENPPVITLSSPSSGIVIQGSLGLVTFTISATQTALLSNGMEMVYDLFITDTNGIVTALLFGDAVVQGSTIR